MNLPDLNTSAACMQGGNDISVTCTKGTGAALKAATALCTVQDSKALTDVVEHRHSLLLLPEHQEHDDETHHRDEHDERSGAPGLHRKGAR